MTKKRRFDYFVVPIDATVNQSIVGLLGEYGLDAASCRKTLLLKEGRRPAYQVPFSVLLNLYHSQKLENWIRVSYYRQSQPDGPVTVVPRKDFQDVRNSPHVQTAQKNLRRILRNKIRRELILGK